MSRIGRKNITIPQGVTCSQEGSVLHFSGPEGKLSLEVSPCVEVILEESVLRFSVSSQKPQERSLWGTTSSLACNMIAGVHKGCERRLSLVGVGYRAVEKDGGLLLSLGFSHDVPYTPPEGVAVKAPKRDIVVVRGADKQKVGQVCATLRRFRPPEPYKGKGVRYEGEILYLKEGKKK